MKHACGETRNLPIDSKKAREPIPGLRLSGGGGGIRTLVTWVTGKTVFETAAFNHSATPPRGGEPLVPFYWMHREGARKIWRRDGDSNPRYPFGAYTISNRAPSASSDISPKSAAMQYTTARTAPQEKRTGIRGPVEGVFFVRRWRLRPRMFHVKHPCFPARFSAVQLHLSHLRNPRKRSSHGRPRHRECERGRSRHPRDP